MAPLAPMFSRPALGAATGVAAKRVSVSALERSAQAAGTKVGVGTQPIASISVVVNGPDRKGLISDFTEKVITPAGASLGRTRMGGIGSDFAICAQVTLPRTNIDRLREDLAKHFEENGYVTGVSLQSQGEDKDRVSEGKLKKISLIGPDAPALIQNLSTLVADNGCNIQQLTSFLQPAPTLGYDNFVATAVFRVPSGNSDSKIKEDFETMAAELGVEITIEDGDLREDVDA